MKSNLLKSFFVALGIGCAVQTICVPRSVITPEEHEYIISLIEEIKNMAVFFEKKCEVFIDPRDKTKYSIFVMSLCKSVDSFKERVFNKLTERIEEETNSDSPTLFLQGLMIFREILSDALARIESVRPILLKYLPCKNDASKALTLSNDIKPYIEELSSLSTMLRTKVDQLHNLIELAGHKELTFDINDLQKFINDLLQTFLKKIREEFKIREITKIHIVSRITALLRNN